MASAIRQTLVMTRANLLSLPRRQAISLSMSLSIALVVMVLAGFLSMAKGFEQALRGAGSPTVTVILGGGTYQEVGSDLPPNVVRSILARRSDLGVRRDAASELIASRELVVPVDVRQPGESLGQTMALRGMDLAGLSLRDGVTLSAGRPFAKGSRELLVGDRLARDFPAFGVGDKIRLGAVDWTVSGHFSAGGSAFESELWADLDAVRAGFDRQGEVQTLRVRLDSPAAIATLRDALSDITETPLVITSEADLYAGQSGRTADLIRLFGWPLALLMAVGAGAGALNTMMSSVADRTAEIAIVRTLGFGRLAAFASTWIEAVLLSLAGAAIGVAASWALFNGWQASTVGANNTRMMFQLAVTGDVMMTAALLGLAIGAIGGALPAIVAIRRR
ncbi:ABC transporter permease [Pleomorphomonas sp. JP5]|uniref:ABC transporter permease n=1 Tax=Pleomorphomonas sp. JP5 TaxID=2942998 RepID=UPI0020447005|nr:ABC transporter permease [Pleomorphomonas sp. JP5]MCM5557675.1 ABC transporter permease [Pleomorphomonas sp. JP5]